MQAVGPLGQGRVEEAERGDRPLDRAGQGAADQAHPFADPEGPGALQDDAGEDPAQRLLGGEAEQDRGEGAADGEGAGVDAGDPQREDHHRRHRQQADDEAERSRRWPGRGAGRGGGESPRTSQWVAAEPTIDQDDDGADPDPLAVAGRDLVAVVVDDQGRRRAPAARRADRRAPLARTAAPARRRGRATARRGCGSRTARGEVSAARRVGIEYRLPAPRRVLCARRRCRRLVAQRRQAPRRGWRGPGSSARGR